MANMQAASTTLWFYLKSASPVFTCTLPAQDQRLAPLLEDVRMVRHGNTIFIHLRSQFEWERAHYFLQDLAPARKVSSAA
ncbi:hypothetical protein [Rufibacter sp. LB8]|uniref:hypothetical protein n=1 Tax=Rufibacter sp. LB8 TaxID=2777781 RepID=UPI00178C406F|nr:hypothetical protein [Rufibacter sp. LB8]